MIIGMYVSDIKYYFNVFVDLKVKLTVSLLPSLFRENENLVFSAEQVVIFKLAFIFHEFE